MSKKFFHNHTIINKMGRISKKNRIECDGCHKEFYVKNLTKIKNKLLCRLCISRLPSSKKISSITQTLSCPSRKKLSTVLSKIYEVNYYKKNGRIVSTNFSLPTCMIGRRFKIVLVDKDGDELHLPKEEDLEK